MNCAREQSHKMQAFERLCIIYSSELQRFIFTMTRKDPFAMEEIYQNTMLGALTGLNNLRDTGKMKSWIFSIAKAESKRYYAASKPRNHLWDSAAEENSKKTEHKMDFTKSIEDKEYVMALINRLSDEEQQLYILHYYYDLTLKVISELLNVNYSTIRSMHMRGMIKLRKLQKHQNRLEKN